MAAHFPENEFLFNEFDDMTNAYIDYQFQDAQEYDFQEYAKS